MLVHIHTDKFLAENSSCVTEWGIRAILYFINSPMMLCGNSMITESLKIQ